MATKSGSVTLRGRFTPGTKVGLYARTGDFFNADTARTLDVGTVGKDGDVSFTGLEPGQRLWIAGQLGDETRAVAMTAKSQTDRVRLSDGEIRKRLAQTRPAETTATIMGPRTTASGRVLGPISNAPFADERVGKPTPKEAQEPRPAPAPRQEDMREVEQRSATLTGQATPKDPDEKVPMPEQEDARKRDQRSATEEGQATPKVKDAPAPGLRQEDARGLEQRSATPEGVATPVADRETLDSAQVAAGDDEPIVGDAKAAAPTRRKSSSRRKR
jgi:hypothetical protein